MRFELINFRLYCYCILINNNYNNNNNFKAQMKQMLMEQFVHHKPVLPLMSDGCHGLRPLVGVRILPNAFVCLCMIYGQH